MCITVGLLRKHGQIVVKLCKGYHYQQAWKSPNDDRNFTQLTCFKASSVVLKFRFLTNSVQLASAESPSSESSSLLLSLCNVQSCADQPQKWGWQKEKFACRRFTYNLSLTSFDLSRCFINELLATLLFLSLGSVTERKSCPQTTLSLQAKEEKQRGKQLT